MTENRKDKAWRKERLRKTIICNTDPVKSDPLEREYNELLFDIERTKMGLSLDRYAFSHVKLSGKVLDHFKSYGYRFKVIK